jgi:nucleoside-diphosphate-sugar epimerase
MSTVDAVVNLAGATTGRIPWTSQYKRELVSSRLDSTRTIVEAIKQAKKKPKVLVSGSASGFYGDCAEVSLSESAPKGTGFLSDLAAQWEKQALEAKSDTRVVLIRTTMVMVQSEVADRLGAEPGGKDYGIPSVKARFFGNVRRYGTVSPTVFWPIPRVYSGLVRIDRYWAVGSHSKVYFIRF